MQYPSLTNRYKIDYSEINLPIRRILFIFVKNIPTLKDYDRGFICRYSSL